ncbi:hypothetical protein L1987_75192 [Smallanthus sonchifolius]|uniref:Uncharacterized protein n=1 Tax=Smallanthus sonchifolius TaxID=185202 RepID=A0ACB9A408_9ASTR|nr:hypothetical protein L1987_75192 [Smallanthus sonchifolius]
MYRDELGAALEGASMADKTVIITIVNRTYTEGDTPMLDIFLDGFWLGEDTRQLTNHLLDTDVLWLRNPFPRLTLLNETIDLQISVDKFNGNQWSQRNMINTGFYMIKSNNKTIALFDKWYGQRNNSTGKKEQDVLVELMWKRVFKRLRLRVRFLDTNYFSGFCQNSRDANVVSTVHANCCRSIRAKVTDLITVIHDWKSDGVYKFPWNNWVSKKVNIFNWRAEMDRIPSLQALSVRHVPLESTTYCFGGESGECTELLVHILADLVWSQVSTWCKIPLIYAFSFKDLMELHKTLK